ncbi:hypothetical protein DITRI_Ditri14bG0022600 [Diplodiscus trichospermus]
MDEKLKTKKVKLPEEGDAEAPHQYQDSRNRICMYCGMEFKSGKALGGHLRIHVQHKPKSLKAAMHHMKSSKPAAMKHSPEAEEEDDSFTCFACDDSFSSMKLLCQHMRKHREMDSNGVQKPIASQESRSSSLSEPAETSFDEGIDTVSPVNDQNQGSRIDFLKHIPSWSQTGKRVLKKTDSHDKIGNKIYKAVALRVYYGSAVPQIENYRREDSPEYSLLTRNKKKKTEESVPNQYASMAGAADHCYELDSLSTAELSANSKQPTTENISIRISNKSNSSSSGHGRLKNPNRAKAVKTVHECEICGKRFQTGQALGGHKTYHRVKPVVPLMGELVQRKAEEELSGESGEVRELAIRMLLPGSSSGESSDPSEESYQQHPKRLRMLDFDLNIPYQG